MAELEQALPGSGASASSRRLRERPGRGGTGNQRRAYGQAEGWRRAYRVPAGVAPAAPAAIQRRSTAP